MSEHALPSASAPRVERWTPVSLGFTVALAGVLALRSPGRKLQWDSANLSVTNAPELNQFVRSEYRKGWAL